ncbi:MAG: 50S ribosomal protein L24 [Clostridia bacterium]
MKMNVVKGDFVKIIAGQDKGKMAKVIKVDIDKNRVYLEGKNIAVVKKSIKAKKASDASGIIDIPKSVAVSNVMPVCATCGKTTRIKHSIVDGKKVRMCECGAILETKKVATKEEKKKSTTVRRKKTETTEAPIEANVEENVEIVAAPVADAKAEVVAAPVAEVKAEVKKTTTAKKPATATAKKPATASKTTSTVKKPVAKKTTTATTKKATSENEVKE